MGVSVVAADGSTYPTGTYANLKYTTTDGATFDTTSKPMLTSDEAKAVAYYPYSSTVSDMTAIPVTTAEQKDYMYSEWYSGLNESSPVAKFEMKHALAAIRINLQKSAGYAADASVTSVKAVSDAFQASATLDATTGSLSTRTGKADLQNASLNQALSTSPYAVDFLVVPGTSAAAITFTATIGGKEYTATTPAAVTLQQGAIHSFTLTLSAQDFSVTNTTVKPWTTIDKGNLTLEKKEDYSDWVKLTYNVTDATQATALFYIPVAPTSLMSRNVENFNISLVEGLIVQDESKTPTLAYQFPEVGTYTVYVKFKDMTYIPSYAFNNCHELTSVSVPNLVETIGEGAFYGCTNLSEIRLPASVTSIGKQAFDLCLKRSSIYVEPGNPVFDSRYNCNAIMETATNTLILGSSNTIIPIDCIKIGDYAFYQCTELTSIIIPNSVKSIGKHAFSYNQKLTEVIIGSDVETIDVAAFSTCTELKDITSLAKVAPQIAGSVLSYVKSGGILYVPEGATGYDAWLNNLSGWSIQAITEYEKYTGWVLATYNVTDNSFPTEILKDYSQVSRVAEMKVLENVKSQTGNKPTTITPTQNYQFSETGTHTIYIKFSDMTTIPDEIFFDCAELVSITIPNSIKTIGYGAFAYCSGLTSIVVDKANPVYDSRNNCNAIMETATNALIQGCMNTIIPNDCQSIGVWAFSGCEGLTNITIPNSVTSIGECAFEGCVGLTSISIPKSVISIGRVPFVVCPALASIVVDKANTIYDSRNNCNAIMETSTNALIQGCMNTVIPDDCKSIEYGAFGICSGLTDITIPNSVQNIGDYAFQGCEGLTEVTIGEGMKTIGEYAFAWCMGLNKITSFAKSAPTIQSGTFDEVSSDGILCVPRGCTDAYSTWMSPSGYLVESNWTIQEITE